MQSFQHYLNEAVGRKDLSAKNTIDALWQKLSEQITKWPVLDGHHASDSEGFRIFRDKDNTAEKATAEVEVVMPYHSDKNEQTNKGRSSYYKLPTWFFKTYYYRLILTRDTAGTYLQPNRQAIKVEIQQLHTQGTNTWYGSAQVVKHVDGKIVYRKLAPRDRSGSADARVAQAIVDGFKKISKTWEKDRQQLEDKFKADSE